MKRKQLECGLGCIKLLCWQAPSKAIEHPVRKGTRGSGGLSLCERLLRAPLSCALACSRVVEVSSVRSAGFNRTAHTESTH
jgi:hypothetical protein